MEQATASRLQMACLSALLDHDGIPSWAQDMPPPLWHWLCFPPVVRQSMLARDGHPIRQEDLSDLPRRMWAGSRVRFLAPIAYDSPLTRQTTILSSVAKTGRTGRLQLVTQRHEIYAAGKIAIIEDQDLVYRGAAATTALSTAATPIARPEGQSRSIVPDERLLFRYSALTFNAHRIHYDKPYATLVEGYSGLVVQGPLSATLLLDHYLRLHPEKTVTAFSFRAIAPAFAGNELTLIADGEVLTAIDMAGRTTMTAEVTVS